MMSNFDLLDRYFSNELDKSELKAFNERLKTDPQFNQEFQEIKEVKLAVKIEARKNLKSLFTDIEDSLNQEELTTNNQTAMKKVLTVAASLILMVSVSYFVLNGSGQPSPQEVFTEYYKPYNNLNGQVRGEAVETESMSAAAYSAYDAGNYALAVENFKALVAVEKTAENYFYMGVANIEIGDYKTAVENLNTTLNNFSKYKDQSKWYLSMALLADKKVEEALSSLVSLSYSNGSYKARGLKALDALGYELLEDEQSGTVNQEAREPEDIDSPGTSDVLDVRQIQYGEIRGFDNRFYKFHNEEPMDDLHVGDIVGFVILKEAKGRNGKGFAFILDRMM